MTWAGGSNSGGTIFSITQAGGFSTLYDFGRDALPQAPLLQATDGKLYGTTQADGTGSAGTVFRLDLGLGPFIKNTTYTRTRGHGGQNPGDEPGRSDKRDFRRRPGSCYVCDGCEIT